MIAEILNGITKGFVTGMQIQQGKNQEARRVRVQQEESRLKKEMFQNQKNEFARVHGGQVVEPDGSVRTISFDESTKGKEFSFRQEKAAKTQAFKERKENRIASKEQGEKEVFLPSLGIKKVVSSRSGALKMRDLATDVVSSRNSLKQLIQIVNKVEANPALATPTSKEGLRLRARANTLSGALMGKLRLALIGPGAVSDQERAFLQAVIADPTKLWSLSLQNRERLTTLKKSVDTQLVSGMLVNGAEFSDQEIRNMGLDPSLIRSSTKTTAGSAKVKQFDRAAAIARLKAKRDRLKKLPRSK